MLMALLRKTHVMRQKSEQRYLKGVMLMYLERIANKF